MVKSKPSGTSEINGSLHHLCGPSNPEVDIVLFHGLQPTNSTKSWWETWSSDDVFWPQELLADDFPHARILSVSYNSAAWRLLDEQEFDIDEVGKKLVSDVLEDAGVGKHDCPVILVGHSLGGLVIKSLILQAHRKRCLDTEQFTHPLSRFLDRNLAGVFYYATPHGGSALADVTKFMGARRGPTPLLKSFGEKAASLNHEFSEWRRNPDHMVPVATVAETCPTGISALGTVVVKRSSASLDSDSVYTVNKDHSSVCKPTQKTDDEYFLLRRFVAENVFRKKNRPLHGWQDTSPDIMKQKEVKQINHSLYELHRPKDRDPEFDVILFHGLQKDHADALLETWSSKGEPMWPRTMLPERFSHARLLTVRYGSWVLKAALKGKLDIYFIGETLVNNMLCDNKADIGNRPVILVAQGRGSLVLKEFILRAEYMRHESRPSIDKFLDGNLRGIFYFAKPPGGFISLELMEEATLVAFTALHLSGRDVTELNNTFHQWLQRRKILVITLAKSKLLSLIRGGTYLIEARTDIANVLTLKLKEICRAFKNREKIRGKTRAENILSFYHYNDEEKAVKAKSQRLAAFIEECLSMDYITKLKPINDSLYELYRPDFPKLDIILFHKRIHSASFEAFWKAWCDDETGDDTTIWPQPMLLSDFPDARVLIVRYNSSGLKTVSGERFRVSETLVRDILCREEADVGNRPVMMVGHELGATVLKDFILRAKDMRAKEDISHPPCNIGKNLIGIFYIAEPLCGSITVGWMKDRGRTVLEKLHLSHQDVPISKLNREFEQWLRDQDHNIQMVTVAKSDAFSTDGGTYLIEAQKDIADFYDIKILADFIHRHQNQLQDSENRNQIQEGDYRFIRYDQTELPKAKYERFKPFIESCQ